MKKIRLTESELVSLIRNIINEGTGTQPEIKILSRAKVVVDTMSADGCDIYKDTPEELIIAAEVGGMDRNGNPLMTYYKLSLENTTGTAAG